MAKQQESPAPKNDLGFGSAVTKQARLRLLNRDGTFNVVRVGGNPFCSLSLYHSLLKQTWLGFTLLLVVAYLGINLTFAVAFFLCGQEVFDGMTAVTRGSRLLECFFFSIQTFATIGYGKISPVGLVANVLVTAEALISMLFFALATGLVFARFSKPSARLSYSDHALIAPYRGISSFQFRIANQRSNELSEVRVTVSYSRMLNGSRAFDDLELERDSVRVFPMNWTIVHPITTTSPLYGTTHEELDASEAEFLVMITAVDESFSQLVYSRRSYRAEEIAWGAKFSSMLQTVGDERVEVDLRKIDSFETAELPKLAETN